YANGRTAPSDGTLVTVRRDACARRIRLQGSPMEPFPATADDALAAPGAPRLAIDHEGRGGTHGLSLVFWLLEQSLWTLAAWCVVCAACVTRLLGGGVETFALLSVALPLL